MKLNPNLLKATAVGALGGLLFGFDTAVIAGTTHSLTLAYALTPRQLGVTVAMALIGTVIGAMSAGIPGQKYGARETLRVLAVFYVLSALGCAFAWSWDTLLLARFLGGLGIGGSSVLGPVYIAELAPPRIRGRLVGMFQINIVIGILLAYLSNFVIARQGLGAVEWRWQFGVAALPAVLFLVMLFGIPQSPRWLRMRAEGIMTDRTATGGGFWTWRRRVPIALAFLVAVLNQLSGINAILYFAPRIFALTGLGEQAALLQSIGIGVTNLLFTFVGLWLIDRLGRRTLLIIGSIGYLLSLGSCAWAFFTHHEAIVPVCIFAFIAAHAVGQGTVIWVLISEIFPNRYRAAGQSLGSATHWVFAALLTTVFPLMVSTFQPGAIFLFFCGMMALQLVWVLTMVPETKGVPLEKIQRRLGLAA